MRFFSDSAGHSAYQSIPLDQLIDAADGGGGVMISPIMPVGGFARELEMSTYPVQENLIDFESYSAPHQDLNNAFMEPTLNSANGSLDQAGTQDPAFDAAYTTPVSAERK